ncbi:MAG: hypothetical protein NTY60_02935 [Proteobacteria bacterium]|nr:hypothetical protein [Pseudomonadota bacterium]
MRILIVLMLLFAAGAQADTLSEAQRAQEAGDYAKAATLFIPLASKGDQVAQFNLGVLYTQGQVIQKDYRIAVQWYLAAAEQGHAQAQANLAELYATGKGVSQDFKKTLHWLTLSAKQGNPSAQLHIGEIYAQGQGVPQDFHEAIKWYRLAADQGDASAHAKLGECYENGLGVAQDGEIAIKWLGSAADNAGDVTSRNRYLARRDALAGEIKDRQIAQKQQADKEAAERAKAAEAVKAEEARIEAEKAAQAQAAEQARQKAAADAALEVQIQAYKQAKIEANAEKLKKQQEAKAERAAESARRKTEHNARFKSPEDQRRAEINAEVARHKAEAAARIKKGDESRLKAPHPAKAILTNEARQHPLLDESESRSKNAIQQPSEQNIEKKKPQLIKLPKLIAAPHEEPTTAEKLVHKDVRAPGTDTPRENASKPATTSEAKGKIKYPAKIELTDEELGHPATPDGTQAVKTPLKQIEWSKKPTAP